MHVMESFRHEWVNPFSSESLSQVSAGCTDTLKYNLGVKYKFSKYLKDISDIKFD